MILYGLYPFVVGELSKALSESVYAIHIVHEGGRVKLFCVMFRESEVCVHVWAVIIARSGWEVELAGHLATVMSMTENPVEPQAFVYDGDRKFVQSVAGALRDHIPMLLPELNIAWLLLIQSEVLKGLHGLDPVGFISYLRCRLESAVGTPFMDKMPALSEVIVFVLIKMFIQFFTIFYS